MLFPMSNIVLDAISPRHQKSVNLNRKEFLKSTKINTEFRVITKPPPKEPTISPSININLQFSATEVFSGSIKQQVSTTNRNPDHSYKLLFVKVSKRKTNDSVRNIHHQEPLPPIQILKNMSLMREI